MRVSIREFTRNIYSYLKRDGEFVVTINGKDAVKIVMTIISPSTDVTTIKEVKRDVMTKDVVTIPKNKLIDENNIKKVLPVYGVYGCGCKKDDRPMCKKHGRY